VTLASPTERSRLRWNPRDRDESRSGSSSRGLARLAPPRRFTAGASTPTGPVDTRSTGPASGRGSTPDILFRPRGFSPPRRLPPHQGCGFVAPRCRPRGSSRCRAPCPRTPDRTEIRPNRRQAADPRGRWGPVRPFPRCGQPFEGFPSPAAVPHHCGLCLPAVARARAHRRLHASRRVACGPRDARRRLGGPMSARSKLRFARGEPPLRPRSRGSGSRPGAGEHHPVPSPRAVDPPWPGNRGRDAAPGALGFKALLH
jgi:hypothetical protein